LLLSLLQVIIGVVVIVGNRVAMIVDDIVDIVVIGVAMWIRPKADAGGPVLVVDHVVRRRRRCIRRRMAGWRRREVPHDWRRCRVPDGR
jgi:hypothetical protein